MNYLSKCDLSNKYLIKSIFFIPKIKQIKLELTELNQFLVDNQAENEKLLAIQYQVFILFYLYFQKLPFLKFLVKRIKNSALKKGYTIHSTLFFSVCFTNQKTIKQFLTNLFIENRVLRGLELKNSLLYNFCAIDQTSAFKMHLLVSSKILEGFDKMNLNLIPALNIQNLFFKITINCLQPVVKVKPVFLLQNFPFFWINA